MNQGWFPFARSRWAGACAVLLAAAGAGSAGEISAELSALIEQQRLQLERQSKLLDEQTRRLDEQQKELEALKRLANPGGETPTALEEAGAAASAKPGDDVRRIVADYLRENPGAGMPPSVQTGYELGRGFTIRSAPNPRYVKWEDDSRIPFELRIRGRMQLAYVGYKSTDTLNHQTGLPAVGVPGALPNASREPDYSQLTAKRVNLLAEGTAFTPDLRYRINFNGFSRGIGGFQNNEVVQSAGLVAPNGLAQSPIGGGVLVSHGVTLFEAFIAYDMRPCGCEKGCGDDCAPGCAKYCPTYTLIAGKFKPFFGLDEFLGNANMQFVEFSMADLFFSADDDARLLAAGGEVKALEDRLFVQAILTNGSDAFTPNLQMDKFPGFILGAWYDLGGTWNEQRKAWDLFGTSIADLEYSCDPVVRLGGCMNLVPMDRRSLYGDAEQARYFTSPGGLGGTRVINMLSGGFVGAPPGTPTLPPGSHAVDKFDAFSYNTFLAAKYKGFSFYNEWWVRQLTNFETSPNGLNNIIYRNTLAGGGNALFPNNHSLIDYGMNVSAGYFLIPKKLEIAARWAWVRGNSGNINGDGTFTTTTVPGVGTVRVINGAFTNYAEANEYTVGVNYYFRKQALKWQTDFSVYDGGNPAGGGQSISGFISGADGYMLRSQFQLFF